MNSRGPPGRGRGGGGRGYGSRGRGYHSGGGRYNNHRGRGDYGGRGGRFIPRGGGGRAPRMGSYSSIGRGGGDGRDHGNHLDRNRDNDNNRVGSYADLASSIPSYSDIGRSVGGGQGDRGGYDGGGGPMQNNSNRDDGGMSSYAQLGEMSQPPPSLGMKRGRPMDDRPHQMMGSNNFGADDNMGPRGGGGPPPSYRGHNNRDDGMPRGPQPPHNDYRQLPDRQDKRSSLSSHQPLPPDWRGRSDSHEDQFGRQLPPKRSSSGYGRGPPVRGHPRFVPDANRVDNNMQRPESLSPAPRRESSYQRFDGQRSSHDSSMPSYASIADKPIHQPVEERPSQQQQKEQHEITKNDDVAVEVVKRDEVKVVESKRRPSTPPPPVEAPAVVVPPSPKSPPSAPPSAYALAMARMMEMNADMDFAWVRMQMLDTEVKLIEARLDSME